MVEPLYWNADGTVACKRHVPKRSNPIFEAEAWAEVRPSLARRLACDRCEAAAATPATPALPSRRPRAQAARSSARRLLVVPRPTYATSALSCHFCQAPADRMLIEDPEQLPPELRPDPVSAQPGCGACDDGTWSRVYPIEGDTLIAARAAAIARRIDEARALRGDELQPAAKKRAA